MGQHVFWIFLNFFSCGASMVAKNALSGEKTSTGLRLKPSAQEAGNRLRRKLFSSCCGKKKYPMSSPRKRGSSMRSLDSRFRGNDKCCFRNRYYLCWIPAFAGMTKKESSAEQHGMGHVRAIWRQSVCSIMSRVVGPSSPFSTSDSGSHGTAARMSTFPYSAMMAGAVSTATSPQSRS